MLLNNLKLKELLDKEERSCAWLSRQIGVSPQTLEYRIDNSLVIAVEKMAAALKVNPEDLIIWETEDL